MIDSLPPRPLRTESAIRGEYRNVERSAWHNIARTILNDRNAQFEYNNSGAPQIVGSTLHISVSHSTTLVAVIISPLRCAIDIESLTRHFDRVASRYITPTEAQLNNDNPDQKALLWSIKECLYKYADQKELNLIGDLQVAKLTPPHFTGSIVPHQQSIQGIATTILNHSLAYIG